jgi:hypothetical protein
MHHNQLTHLLSIVHHQELIEQATRQRNLNQIRRTRPVSSFWRSIQSTWNKVAHAAGNASQTLNTDN